MDETAIGKVVANTIADIKNIPADKLDPNSTFVADLKVTGDDFTFVFVPMVERSLGIQATTAEWKGVRSVGDAVQMLAARARGK